MINEGKDQFSVPKRSPARNLKVRVKEDCSSIVEH